MRTHGKERNVSRKLALGIVGAGSISQVAHLPAVTKNTNVELRGFCDGDRKKAKALAVSNGVSVATTDIVELVEQGGCDAVIIATPTCYHFSLAKAALENGAHVFLEMPPVASLSEARALEEIAHQTGRVVAPICHKRYRADSQRLWTMVANGDLGTLQYIRFMYSYERSSLLGSWRGKVSLSGGGVFMDQGVQLLDLGLFLASTEEVRSVSAALFAIEGREELEEGATVMFRLGNGVILTMLLAPWLGTGDPGLRLQAYGSGGTASLPGLEIHKELDGSPVTVVPRLSTPRREIFQQSYRDALNVLTKRVLYEPETLSVSAAGIVALMNSVEHVYRSAKEQREITLA
jgi:predicted dehydrogenase